MSKPATTLDKPEPRWQALLALLAVGGINLALPDWLNLAPKWILPSLVLGLLIPSIVTHRTRRFRVNYILGLTINGVITVDLIGSVVLLVDGLATHPQKGMPALVSGGALWLSNVLVFALWYWRLDGGGPNEREEHPEFGSRSFLFPQMQIEKSERSRFGVAEKWRPHFIDYLFLALMQSSTFGPTDTPILSLWAKVVTMIQVLISLVIVVLLISHAVGAI
ncbi:MAG: hypothetical protein ABI992_08830 [Chthoniobacterales bacterium]